MSNLTTPISLYLHIPFCPYRCSYCDFNTYTSVTDLRDQYGEALAYEIKAVAQGAELAGRSMANRPVRSIGFGGGTPSMMSLESMSHIMETIHANYATSSDTAASLEINPETVTVDYLKGLKALGIGRISIGAQSAVPSELTLLGREHDFNSVVDAVAMCREAGLDDINVDLIYGVPYQTMASWQQSVEAVLALESTHLSLYCLGVEPGTAMARWVDNGTVADPDPDLAADQYMLATELLADSGYEQYEISNWSKPGYQSQHSLVYWRFQDYLGLGAGAHGYVDGVRYDVVKQPRVYLRRLAEPAASLPYPYSAAVANHELEDEETAMSTMVLMQLRLLQEGLDTQAFEARFGQSIMVVYGGIIERAVGDGLLRWQGERLLLTETGRFISNQLFVQFI